MAVLVDTHCHLDAAEFDADRDAVLTSARAAGVGAFVVPAIAPANFAAVQALAAAAPDVVYALGIHPLALGETGDDALAALEAALRAACDDPRLVAVGEIGLDFFVPGVDVARQERFYEAQLRLARGFGLPVLLHVRRSQDRLLKYLRSVGSPGGIAHAFNGSRQQADAFTRLGFALGFGGAATFPRAARIRALAAGLPIEAIVLETDAPDIAPAWLANGERNAPGELPRIAATIAGLRGVPVDELIAATYTNAHRVLPRLARGLRPGDG